MVSEQPLHAGGEQQCCRDCVATQTGAALHFIVMSLLRLAFPLETCATDKSGSLLLSLLRWRRLRRDARGLTLSCRG